MDESALILYEVNGPSLDSTSVRRWRHIVVVRGNAPAEYLEDMGPASAFGDEISIPGGVAEGGRFFPVETVGRLIDYAEDIARNPFDRNIPSLDLVNGYHDVMEQRQRVLNGERP